VIAVMDVAELTVYDWAGAITVREGHPVGEPGEGPDH
jgi:hypothetical protein